MGICHGALLPTSLVNDRGGSGVPLRARASVNQYRASPIFAGAQRTTFSSSLTGVTIWGTFMEYAPIIAAETGGLLHEDGSTTLLDTLAEWLACEIKGHGHYGNVMHHVAGGNWTAVGLALQELFVLPQNHGALSPLARNLVTMLHGSAATNLQALRPWLLDRVEWQTANLYRRIFERTLDVLAGQIRTTEFVFTKSASRILHEAK